MDLRARLRVLAGEAGSVPAGSPAAQLRERLARVSLEGRARWSGPALAGHLGGTLVAEDLIRFDDRHLPNSPYGETSLVAPGESVEILGVPSGATGTVFLDTETSGLSGGVGTLVFLVGLARFEPEGLRLAQWLMTAIRAEAALLNQMCAWFANATHLVTYNGKSFDVPLLDARLRLSGRSSPFGSLKHVDLLHATRRAFAGVWPDCRLQTAEARILGLHRVDDLPGAEVARAWLAYLRHGETRDLPGLLRHNRLDVVSLAALLTHLADVHHGAPRLAEFDAWGVARGCARRGQLARAIEILRERQETLGIVGWLGLADLHRRAGAWSEAVAIWERLAREGVRPAMERLAIYLEHQVRDAAGALLWCERLASAAGGERYARRLARLRARASQLRFQG